MENKIKDSYDITNIIVDNENDLINNIEEIKNINTNLATLLKKYNDGNKSDNLKLEIKKIVDTGIRKNLINTKLLHDSVNEHNTDDDEYVVFLMVLDDAANKKEFGVNNKLNIKLANNIGKLVGKKISDIINFSLEKDKISKNNILTITNDNVKNLINELDKHKTENNSLISNNGKSLLTSYGDIKNKKDYYPNTTYCLEDMHKYIINELKVNNPKYNKNLNSNEIKKIIELNARMYDDEMSPNRIDIIAQAIIPDIKLDIEMKSDLKNNSIKNNNHPAFKFKI